MKRIENELSVSFMGWRDRLAEAIRLRGVTQAEVADASGMSRRAFNYLLLHASDAPSYAVSVRISDFLNVDPDVLWDAHAAPVPRRWPLRWRRFAARHGMTLKALVIEAVANYIDTTEAYEHEYRPPATTALAVPLVVMPAMFIRAQEPMPLPIAKPDPPPFERYDGRSMARDLTPIEVEYITSKRDRRWGWEAIGEHFGVNRDTIRSRYERALATQRPVTWQDEDVLCEAS
jgi:transcriptional regulator with XRE-family HTH domain